LWGKRQPSGAFFVKIPLRKSARRERMLRSISVTGSPIKRPSVKANTSPGEEKAESVVRGRGSTITQGSLKYYDYVEQAAQCNMCRAYKRMQKARLMSQALI
jgi:hypothetical protein